MRKYVSSTPLVKTLLSDFRQLYFEKVRSLAPTPTPTFGYGVALVLLLACGD